MSDLNVCVCVVGYGLGDDYVGLKGENRGFNGGRGQKNSSIFENRR